MSDRNAPAKKRRYTPARVEERDVPEGFERDELADEDEADDPDFVGEEEEEEEEGEEEESESDADGGVSGHLVADAGGGAAANFEVDELESTDEDDALGRAARGGASSMGDARMEEEDEEEDEEPYDDDEFEDDDDDMDDDAGRKEGGGEDYVRFLVEMLGETENEAQTGANGVVGDVGAGMSSAGPSFMDDDDDFDFDYLRESAAVRDDPLEYRDDRAVHVSRRELVQLLNGIESNLRRRTRRAAPAFSLRKRDKPLPAASAPVAPLAPAPPALPNEYGPGVPIAAPVAPLYAPQAPVYAAGPALSAVNAVVPPPFATTPVAAQPYVPLAAANPGLAPETLRLFREQLATHVQLLVTVHAAIRYRNRGEDVATDEESRADDTLASSAALLNALMEKREVSQKYIRMLAPYHNVHATAAAGVAPFAGKLSLRRTANDSERTSYFHTPALDAVPAFLNDTTSVTAAEALQRFSPYFNQQTARALAARPQRVQNMPANAREGWLPWGPADDTLLALTLAKHSQDFGEMGRDLLPHRVVADCQSRVKFLASRRCGDNAVKRHVLANMTPLNRQELSLVQYGLQRFGGASDAAENPELWKVIQRELLPTRDWSLLQKLWAWRETRRVYKQRYRAKESARKKASKSAAAAPATPFV